MQRSLQPFAAARADRDHQGVVGELAADREVCLASGGVDAVERVLVQRRFVLAGDLGELEQMRLGKVERRRHRQRLVDEVAIGATTCSSAPTSSSARSASSVSTAATPPPQMTTRLGVRNPYMPGRLRPRAARASRGKPPSCRGITT